MSTARVCRRGAFLGDETKIRCANCAHEQRVRLGVGFLYSSLEGVIELVRPEDQQLVLELPHGRDVKSVEYEHALFACPCCRELEGHFYFRPPDDDGQVLQSEYECGRSGARLRLATEDVGIYPCRACGRAALTKELEVMWD